MCITNQSLGFPTALEHRVGVTGGSPTIDCSLDCAVLLWVEFLKPELVEEGCAFMQEAARKRSGEISSPCQLSCYFWEVRGVWSQCRWRGWGKKPLGSNLETGSKIIFLLREALSLPSLFWLPSALSVGHKEPTIPIYTPGKWGHPSVTTWPPLHCPFAVGVPNLPEGYAPGCSPLWGSEQEGNKGPLAITPLL